MLTATIRPGVTDRTLVESDGFCIGRTDYADGLRQARHFHETASVSLILSGAVEERVGTRRRAGGALSAVVKRAGVEHMCEYAGGTRMLSIELDDGSLDRADGVRSASARAEWRWLHDPGVAARILEVHRLAAAGRFSGRADDLATEVAAATGTFERPGPGAPPRWLLAAEESLRANGGRRPTIRDLAKDVGVHPVHLARAFRRYFGRTPTAHAAWLRLRRAAEGLAQDPRSASVVALDVGFSDHSHLCREFSSRLGISPSAFRGLAGALT